MNSTLVDHGCGIMQRLLTSQGTNALAHRKLTHKVSDTPVQPKRAQQLLKPIAVGFYSPNSTATFSWWNSQSPNAIDAAWTLRKNKCMSNSSQNEIAPWI
jgi:hypothetical protein